MSIMVTRSKYSGFTIVELLIVVVVIAILAAITIVAYNGIQVRSENAKTISAVQAYRKALLQYATEKGSYPITGGYCLGTQYPVLDGTTSGCRHSSAVLPNTTAITFAPLLQPYLGGNSPMPSTRILYNAAGTTGYVGIYFYGTNYNYTLDGEKVVGIWYTIEDSSCPVGPVYSTTGNPNFTSPAVTRTSAITTSTSLCLILLPDASRL